MLKKLLGGALFGLLSGLGFWGLILLTGWLFDVVTKLIGYYWPDRPFFACVVIGTLAISTLVGAVSFLMPVNDVSDWP